MLLRVAGLLALMSPANAAPCALLPQFTEAIAARNVDRARQLEAEIRTDAECRSLDDDVKLELAELEIQMGIALPSGSSEREKLLNEGDELLQSVKAPAIDFDCCRKPLVVEGRPVPITFRFGTTQPTPIGLVAEAEMANLIKALPVTEVLLVGHTDRIGGDAYNMKLSELRAIAVTDFLVQHGVTVPIKILARGKREPLSLEAADAANLTKKEINQLNRRVEWRREQAE